MGADLHVVDGRLAERLQPGGAPAVVDVLVPLVAKDPRLVHERRHLRGQNKADARANRHRGRAAWLQQGHAAQRGRMAPHANTSDNSATLGP